VFIDALIYDFVRIFISDRQKAARRRENGSLLRAVLLVLFFVEK
jgi:hypothetical protein